MQKHFAYKHFTSNEIKPAGWLKRQLEIQAEGLSGHLDKMWPDVKDSAWIGGDREGWERVPYWLDGFIPLAWLLDDADLKARAQKYIDAILFQQCTDGWICPCDLKSRETYDVWPVFLICKVLVLYYECTNDARIESVVSRTLSNLYQHISSHTLFNWGQSRWFEALIPIGWLYERTKESWLEDLAILLSAQGLDYKRLFSYWTHQTPKREWNFHTHIVNLMMALKCEALFSPISKEDPNAFAEEMFQILSKYHGTCVGHITGDECLSGTLPTQGAELCSIAEALYSYETLFEITGNPVWCDRAEVAAFNSLPASISDDMWTHQYDQMVNQISCTTQNEPPVFGTNAAQANLFGLEPNFGCCTANFNQAWPKLALHSFYYADQSIVSALLIPSTVHCQMQDACVEITLQTDYPFKGSLHYTVSTDRPVTFEFAVRIPSFAQEAYADDKRIKTGELYKCHRTWNGKTEIQIDLIFTPTLLPCESDTFCLRHGPLFYSVPIETEYEKKEYIENEVERKFPYCDYEIRPISDWNYAFAANKFTVYEHSIGLYPFSRTNPPITIETEMVQIDWGTMPNQPGVCNPFPQNRRPIGCKKIMRLQPYGCTTLRMTQLPFVKEIH